MRALRTLAALGTIAFAGTANAQVVYSNDFQSNTSGFTATGGGVGQVGTPSNCASVYICVGGPGTVLGRANGGLFDNHTATLTLNGLLSHTSLTLSFHLLIVNSWDGNNGPGPDYFELLGPNGQTLLNTTFANVGGYPQSYPADWNGAAPINNPTQTGAAEVNVFGAGWDYYGTSLYTMSFTVAHTGSSAAFDFTGYNLQGWSDEGWALDNVQVVARGGSNVVPEPGTVALLAAGLAGVATIARRRRA